MSDKNDVMEKRSGFVERWARAEEISAFLRITLYAIITFSVVLLVVLFKVATKPQAIYYIPGDRKSVV